MRRIYVLALAVLCLCVLTRCGVVEGGLELALYPIVRSAPLPMPTSSNAQHGASSWAIAYEARMPGARLFADHCSKCHLATAAPPLHAKEWVSDDALATWLITGRPRAGMPAWTDLTAEQRREIAQFARTLGP